MYQIKPIHIAKAKALGVRIAPSTDRKKKLDIYDYHHNFICSIGDISFGDYETYKKSHGIDYASSRRALYKARHEATRHKLGSPSYYSWKILWE
jgi:hypothetical protein